MGSVAVHDYDRTGRILTMRTNPTLANGVPTNNGASLTMWTHSRQHQGAHRGPRPLPCQTPSLSTAKGIELALQVAAGRLRKALLMSLRKISEQTKARMKRAG